MRPKCGQNVAKFPSISVKISYRPLLRAVFVARRTKQVLKGGGWYALPAVGPAEEIARVGHRAATQRPQDVGKMLGKRSSEKKSLSENSRLGFASGGVLYLAKVWGGAQRSAVPTQARIASKARVLYSAYFALPGASGSLCSLSRASSLQ